MFSIRRTNVKRDIFFHVDDPVLRLSDHSKISVRMIANFSLTELNTCSQSFPEQFKWVTISPQLFTESLRSEEINSKPKTVLDTQINNMSDVNTIVANFSNILISVANSLKKRKTRNEKTNTNKKWFDLDLIKNLIS